MKIRLSKIEHNQAGFATLAHLASCTQDCLFDEIEIDMSAVDWFDADMCAVFGAILSQHAAIGQLYGEFSEDQIQAFLKVEDIEPDDLALLKRVVETAKEYFKDPQRFDQVVRDELGDEGDGE